MLFILSGFTNFSAFFSLGTKAQSIQKGFQQKGWQEEGKGMKLA
jgi:hypothetical protein